jgi:hypothetical protein
LWKEKKHFFLCNKETKNSYLLGIVATVGQMPAVNRSFVLLFFKKEALPFVCSFRLNRGEHGD